MDPYSSNICSSNFNTKCCKLQHAVNLKPENCWLCYVWKKRLSLIEEVSNSNQPWIWTLRRRRESWTVPSSARCYWPWSASRTGQSSRTPSGGSKLPIRFQHCYDKRSLIKTLETKRMNVHIYHFYDILIFYYLTCTPLHAAWRKIYS